MKKNGNSFNKKHLAFLLPNLLGGGAQRVVLNLANGIARRDYPVDLVVARTEGPYLEQISRSVRLVDLKASRVLFSLPSLVRYLRTEQPVAMLTTMNYVNLVGLWAQRLARVPTRVVFTEHSILSIAIQYSISRRGRLIPFLMRQFYPWADEIVAVSQGTANDLAQTTRVSKRRIKVIYNPIITPEMRQKVKAIPAHPWFQPDQPAVILAVGRLNKQKDFALLIRAIGQVNERIPVRLLILGDGLERPNLERLIAQLDLEEVVSMPGFDDNPYGYMSQADLFVLSSRAEALPTVLAEAMYCGVPLISTDCPGGAREILKDGRYGQLVPVDDVNALAEAIIATLAEPPPAAPQESWLPFEMEIVVDQYLNCLLGDQF